MVVNLYICLPPSIFSMHIDTHFDWLNMAFVDSLEVLDNMLFPIMNM